MQVKSQRERCFLSHQFITQKYQINQTYFRSIINREDDT